MPGMEQSSAAQESRRKHVTTACVACRESKVKVCPSFPDPLGLLTATSGTEELTARPVQWGDAGLLKLSEQRQGVSIPGERRQAQVGHGPPSGRVRLRGADLPRLSLRLAVELLHARVQQLSQLLEDNGLEIPPPPRLEDAGVLSSILHTLGLTEARPQSTGSAQEGAGSENITTQRLPGAQHTDGAISSPESTTAPTSNMSSLRVLENAASSPQPATRGLLELANAAGNTASMMQTPASWDWNISAEPMAQGAVVQPGYISTPTAQRPSISAAAPSCPSLDMDKGTSPTESIDELADQLSDRLGTLHVRPGGHIRFYGPTSNFNLLETPPSDVSMNIHRTIRNDGEDHLARLGLNKRVPPEIELHLMNLYFTWQDPAFHVVDRQMFEEAKDAWHIQMEDTAYYSEALRNAM